MVWIEKAFDERSNAMVYINVGIDDPELRRDPRFKALMARIGRE